MLAPLPINELLPDLCAALTHHANAVVRAPTGAGKTTRVPPALLDAGLAGSGKIVLLEPRRLAARAAARRMAQERGSRLGDDIGYHVRFDRCAGPNTRILVVTPGILLRMLHDDPFLESFAIVVLDEFHERGLESDLALGLVRLIQQTVRPELRLLAMSATLAVEAVAKYLGDAPILVSEGRSFPVEVRHESGHARTMDAIPAAVGQLLKRTTGDLLVFLPGMREIRQASRHLEPLATEHDLAVVPLYGDLPAEQQDAALLPQPRRKVILATNVAETSVTVEGVTGVVDTGLARVLRFDPRLGLDRLRVEPISKASAEQRTGRAGRTQPGICVRLWSERSHRGRAEHTDPEIRRVDLAGAVLQLLALGENDPMQFPWLEPPPAETIQQALALLEKLGAVDQGAITDLGRTIARLPVHPRLGGLLVEGSRLGQAERSALAAALLSEREPFDRNATLPSRPGPVSLSDVLDRVEALEEFERTKKTEFPVGQLHRGPAHFVLRARDQLRRLVRQEKIPMCLQEMAPDEALRRALLAAFPDRVVKRRGLGQQRGRMVGGRGVQLAPSSRVQTAPLFLAIDVDAGQSEALVRQASAIEQQWLPSHLMRSGIEVFFDERAKQVQARKRLCYEDLILEENPAALPEADEVARVLASAAAQSLQEVLPPPDAAAGIYLTRLRCLAAWMPELHLPPCTDDDLRATLPWLCAGKRSFVELRGADWLGALRGRLSFALQQAVEREAPEHWPVPSGSRIALKYEAGRPPILAVRIQELFGLTDTPCVAGGRVKVLLHLLAPNFRPQQVTDDLASFWANTYPLIRKELRARYPKHAWPEDPLTAEPARGPKRKKG